MNKHVTLAELNLTVLRETCKHPKISRASRSAYSRSGETPVYCTVCGKQFIERKLMGQNNTLYGELYNRLGEHGLPHMVDGFPNFDALECIKDFFRELVAEGRIDSYYATPKSDTGSEGSAPAEQTDPQSS